MCSEYAIKPINGHFELYIDGKFECSADTMPEAVAELEKIMFNKKDEL